MGQFSASESDLVLSYFDLEKIILIFPEFFTHFLKKAYVVTNFVALYFNNRGVKKSEPILSLKCIRLKSLEMPPFICFEKNGKGAKDFSCWHLRAQ